MNLIHSDSQVVPAPNSNPDIVANSSTQPQEESKCPLVSFGVPVYNATDKYMRRLLDSLLAQTMSDFEVVISDNASSNGTSEICQEYARRDQRIRYHRNPENIGQIANFNRVLELASGKYFRWIGSDDWLEPDYARKCVDTLEARPNDIGVTTYQDHIGDDGIRLYREYTGERFESPLPHVRFRRMLWFFNADHILIDPIYTMMRREILLTTPLLQFVPATDQLLSTQLSLLGTFAHIPECLAHRRQEFWHKISQKETYKSYAPKRYKELSDPLGLRIPALFLSAAWNAPISNWEKILCLWPVVRCAVIRRWNITYTQLAQIKAFLKNQITSFKKIQHF